MINTIFSECLNVLAKIKSNKRYESELYILPYTKRYGSNASGHTFVSKQVSCS